MIELIAMKKSRKKPNKGDVFIVQPKENVFYFGKVIKTEIVSKDSFINGMSLIYIYNSKSNNKNVPNKLDPKDLLIPPIVVNNQSWLKGYFETICNIDVTKEELELDFGFYDMLRNRYLDTEGKVLNREPKIWSDYGLGSYGVIDKEIKKAINTIE